MKLNIKVQKISLNKEQRIWNLQKVPMWTPRPLPGVGSTVPHLFQSQAFKPPPPFTSLSQPGELRTYFKGLANQLYPLVGWYLTTFYQDSDLARNIQQSRILPHFSSTSLKALFPNKIPVRVAMLLWSFPVMSAHIPVSDLSYETAWQDTTWCSERHSGNDFVVGPWIFGRWFPSLAACARLFKSPPALLLHTCGWSLNQTFGMGMQLSHTSSCFCFWTPAPETLISLFFNLDLEPFNRLTPSSATRSPTIPPAGSSLASITAP